MHILTFAMYFLFWLNRTFFRTIQEFFDIDKYNLLCLLWKSLSLVNKNQLSLVRFAWALEACGMHKSVDSYISDLSNLSFSLPSPWSPIPQNAINLRCYYTLPGWCWYPNPFLKVIRATKRKVKYFFKSSLKDNVIRNLLICLNWNTNMWWQIFGYKPAIPRNYRCKTWWNIFL